MCFVTGTLLPSVSLSVTKSSRKLLNKQFTSDLLQFICLRNSTSLCSNKCSTGDIWTWMGSTEFIDSESYRQRYHNIAYAILIYLYAINVISDTDNDTCINGIFDNAFENIFKIFGPLAIIYLWRMTLFSVFILSIYNEHMTWLLRFRFIGYCRVVYHTTMRVLGCVLFPPATTFNGY